MPNIMPLEVVVVGAGFLVLCVFPALVTWADARARRRSRTDEPATPLDELTAPITPEAIQPPLPAELCPTATSSGPDPLAGIPGPPGIDAATARPAPVVPPSSTPAEQALPPAGPQAAAVAPLAPPMGPSNVHEFRLQDLRRARLLDWPPAAVRDDSERYRVWQEGLRMAATHQARVEALVLHADYVPQSACLAGAEIAGSWVRLRYFVFRDLWPVAESQAVSEIVVEIDDATGGVSSRLEPHQSAH